MYGLACALCEQHLKYDVLGSAQAFEVDVDGADVSDVASAIAHTMFKYKERINEKLSNRLRLIQRDSSRRLTTYLNSMSDEKEVLKYLSEYLAPGHARSEGRWASGGQHVWLPFYPHIGKYFTKEFKHESRNYGVCQLCIALAALGIYKAAVSVFTLTPRKPPIPTTHVIVLSFEGRVAGDLLNQIVDCVGGSAFDEKIRRVREAAQSLPLSVFIQIVLACLTPDLLIRLHKAEALWRASSATFEVVKGGVVQVRGYEDMVVDRYLSSLVHLMLLDEERSKKTGEPPVDPLERLRKLTERLLREEEPGKEEPAAVEALYKQVREQRAPRLRHGVAIEALYRFLNTRAPSDLYTASRQVFKALKEGLGREFCKVLACLIR